jgi:hypothetical protein
MSRSFFKGKTIPNNRSMDALGAILIEVGKESKPSASALRNLLTCDWTLAASV